MSIKYRQKTKDWQIRVTHRRTEYKRVAPTKAAAEAIVAELKKEFRMSELDGQGWKSIKPFRIGREPKTFEALAAAYMQERAANKISTIKTYEDILKNHLLPAFGKMLITDIEPTHIRKLQVSLKQKKLSAKRVNNIVGLFGYILTQAAGDGLLDTNPYSAIRTLEEQKPDINPFTPEELSKVLNCVEPLYKPFFVVQAYTGARPGELLALRWSAVNWLGNEININKNRVRKIEGTPKTRESRRILPLLPPARAVLEELKSQKTRGLDDHIFLNRSHKPFDGDHLARRWSRALKKAELAHRPSYQLRHTFASMLLAQGLQPASVASLLGHATLETFFRHYARWIKGSTATEKEKLLNLYSTPAQKLAQ